MGLVMLCRDSYETTRIRVRQKRKPFALCAQLDLKLKGVVLPQVGYLWSEQSSVPVR